jgi:hypothetical protein
LPSHRGCRPPVPWGRAVRAVPPHLIDGPAYAHRSKAAQTRPITRAPGAGGQRRWPVRLRHGSARHTTLQLSSGRSCPPACAAKAATNRGAVRGPLGRQTWGTSSGWPCAPPRHVPLQVQRAAAHGVWTHQPRTWRLGALPLCLWLAGGHFETDRRRPSTPRDCGRSLGARASRPTRWPPAREGIDGFPPYRPAATNPLPRQDNA